MRNLSGLSNLASYLQAKLQPTWPLDNGRMSGSVKDFTARRARNTINHFNDKDYDDDWSKLNEWGQKFMELNPQCLFDLEKDEENR